MSTEALEIVYKTKGPNDLIENLNVPSGLTLSIKSGATIIAEAGSTVTGFGGGGGGGGGDEIGTVKAWAGDTPPTNWLFCDGSAVSRTDYADLFTLIGTTYGTGDGTTTFNIPDIRGRVIAGADNMGGTSANRLTDIASGGVDGSAIGNAGGEEAHVLIVAELAEHTHSTSASGPSDAQSGTDFFATTNADTDSSPAGSDNSHNNVQPTIVLNYIIKALGSTDPVITPPSSVGININGGGSAITTGVKGWITIPYNCTINSVTLLADQSGSIVVDIWKCTYAQYDAGATHPVVGDSIVASAPPTISGATKSTDATLTGWNKTVNAGDVLAYNVNSASAITRLSLTLKVSKT